MEPEQITEIREKGIKYAPTSLNVKLCTYSTEKCLLLMDFVSGASYIYKDFPLEAWDDLVKYPSVGQFLSRRIKGNYYFEKIEEKKDEGRI